MPEMNPLQNLSRKPLWKYKEVQGDIINGDSENIQHHVDWWKPIAHQKDEN
jgi:hypothetical protein